MHLAWVHLRLPTPSDPPLGRWTLNVGGAQEAHGGRRGGSPSVVGGQAEELGLQVLQGTEHQGGLARQVAAQALIGDHHHLHPGRQGRLHPVGRVFEDQALWGQESEMPCTPTHPGGCALSSARAPPRAHGGRRCCVTSGLEGGGAAAMDPHRGSGGERCPSPQSIVDTQRSLARLTAFSLTRVLRICWAKAWTRGERGRGSQGARKGHRETTSCPVSQQHGSGLTDCGGKGQGWGAIVQTCVPGRTAYVTHKPQEHQGVARPGGW